MSYHANQLPENLELELVPAPGLEPRTLFQHELVDKPIELTACLAAGPEARRPDRMEP